MYEVFRDDDLLKDTIIPQARTFWFDNVCKLVEPAAQSGDVDLMKTLYTECEKGSEIILDSEVDDDLVTTIQDCKSKIKALTAIQKQAENALKDKMKSVEIAQTINYTVKWSPQVQRRIDSELLKTRYPGVAQECMKEIHMRVMRISGGLDL